jgi:hypothetical protein
VLAGAAVVAPAVARIAVEPAPTLSPVRWYKDPKWEDANRVNYPYQGPQFPELIERGISIRFVRSLTTEGRMVSRLDVHSGFAAMDPRRVDRLARAKRVLDPARLPA